MDIELGSRFRLFQPGRATLTPSYFLCVFWDESNNMTRPCLAQTIGDTLGPIVLELTEMGSPNYEDAEVELYAGDWQLTVYEQTSSTNYDPALSGREVWSELVRVNEPDTPQAPRQPYNGPIVPDANRVCLVPCVYGTPTDGQVIGWNATEVRSEWQTAGGGGGGTGDVTGPSSATNNNFASYNGTTGKIIKDSGSNAASFDAAGAASAAQAAAIAAAASDATTKANAAQAAAIASAASDATTKANAAQAAAIASASSDATTKANAAQAAAIAAAASDATTKANAAQAASDPVGSAAAAQAAAIAASQPLNATLTALGNMGVPVCLCGTAFTLTNQTNALAFLFATIFGPRVDLTTFTEVKFQIGVSTGSASANTPKAILRYFTSFSTTTTDYLNIGTSEVSCSLTTAGIIETAWIPLAAGAIGANKFLRVLISGGDGAADPATSVATAFFR